MDDVLTGFYTDSETEGINRCRLYLQVECLSDICTAEGASLNPRLRDKPPAVTSTSTIHWPRQGLPGPRSWAIWCRFLKTYTRDSASDRLRHTLARGLNPIFEMGIHTTTHPHKCFVSRCIPQQRPALNPPGTTIQPLSRTRDAFSHSQRATHLPTNALTSTRYQSRYF
jgi:hypothetical protein